MKINIDSLIESLPMVAPNLNGYKANFDFYFCPWSNYYGWMDNNVRSDAGAVSKPRWKMAVGHDLHILTVENFIEAMTDNSVKPGSLLDYLGYSPGFIGRQVNEINGARFHPLDVPAEKFLSVLDIYRNYYVNNQEERVYFLAESSDPRTQSDLFWVGIDELDKITRELRHRDSDSISNVFQALSNVPCQNHSLVGIYTNLGQVLSYILSCSYFSPLGGLPLRTYRMDLNRGLLKNTDSQYVSRVSIDRENGFSIDTLRFANKMQKLLDRIDVSGGRFSDMMRARWGVTPRNTLDIPDYLGTVSNFFGVTDVISTASGMNSEVENGRGNSVLGQQAGFAVGKVKRNNAPISFRSDQYGTLVCMFSLVPIVTYSQGIELEDLKTSFSEVFDPAFNQLGYQDVSSLELCALPQFSDIGRGADDDPVVGSDFDFTSNVGRRFAWSEYMSSLPRAHGLFAYGQDFDYWVNNRMYQRSIPYGFDIDESQGTPSFVKLLPYGPMSLSTYVDPSVQNNLFADIRLTAQNFRLRVNFDIWMRRNVGSRVMPHL